MDSVLVQSVNWWAVLVAAVSAFILGGPWYSEAMFGKAWKRESGNKTPGAGHPAKVFGIAFLWALVAAAAFACIVGPAPELKHSLSMAAVVGFGFVASSYGVNYQFAGRSFLMWLIDAGYHFVKFMLYGLIIGLWH